MAYISLYRKYRPQTFEDVVGQAHVTTTLRNAVSEGRVASGYLFTGTRGTAKTTCARILAKALNCIGPDGSLTAPTPEPCGVCGPCRSIASSSFVDVIEMDAASHRGIDDMRDIVNSIKFPPMEGRYKVYIIDEAHQLTSDSKDAFLKTLEEPPDRVTFILATTEVDKMPITIQSRCQVYEFKRGSVGQISERVADVLRAEGVAADPAAVTLIARAADGSYRDSLSLLEQVLAYERGHVTVKDVTTVLGTIDEDVLRQVVDLIADSDAAGAFALAGTVLESGKDIRQFLKSLVERFRDMLFLGVGARPAGPDDLDDSAALRAQASRFAPSALLQALEVLTAAEGETKRSAQHRLILEMSLLRLMRLPSVAAAVAPLPAPAGKVPTPAQPHPTPEPESEEASPVPAPPLPVSGGAARSSGVGSTPAPPSGAAAPVLGTGGDALFDDMPPPLAEEELSDLGGDAGDEELDTPPLDGPADDQPSLIVVTAQDHDQAQDLLDDLLQVQQVAGETPPAAPPRPAPAADAPPELLRLQKSWQEVVNLTGTKSKAAAKDMTEARPVDLNGDLVILEFVHPFHYERVQGKEALREYIAENICRTLDVPAGTYRVKCIMKGQLVPQRPLQNGHAQGAVADVPEMESQSDEPSAFVQKVIAVFGGDLLDDDAR